MVCAESSGRRGDGDDDYDDRGNEKGRCSGKRDVEPMIVDEESELLSSRVPVEVEELVQRGERNSRDPEREQSQGRGGRKEEGERR